MTYNDLGCLFRVKLGFRTQSIPLSKTTKKLMEIVARNSDGNEGE